MMAAEAGLPDTSEILAGIEAWARIESPTDDPAGMRRMADAVEAEYRALGAAVAVERIAGVDGFGDHLLFECATDGGLPDAERPGILVLSHMDTVHPVGTLGGRLPFRVEGDLAYGPGIADMKGGAYLALAAVRQMLRSGVRSRLPVRHLVTSDEEMGSPTSRAHIVREARRARYVLVTEPARSGGKIVVARKGVGHFRLELTGRPAHAGVAPETGRSAIRELARQVLALEALTDYERGITVNVGRVQGGSRANVVAESAWAEIDVRVPDAASGEAMERHLRGLRAHDPDVRLVMTGGIERPGYEMDAGIEALFERAKRIAGEIGFVLEGLKTGGGSDGNFTAAVAPTLDGLGVDGEGAHTLEERMYVSSIVPRTRLLMGLFAGLD